MTLITAESDPVVVQGVADYVYCRLVEEDPCWFDALGDQPQPNLEGLRALLDVWARRAPEALEKLGGALSEAFEKPGATHRSIEVVEGVADVVGLALWRGLHAFPDESWAASRRRSTAGR